MVGAQIITGLNGNPLDTLLRRQLDVKIHYLKNAIHTRIYDSEGKLVETQLDQECEIMFNEALEKAVHTFMKDGTLRLDMDNKIRRTEFAIEGFGGEAQPSLGQALLYHLKQIPGFLKLTMKQMKLIHWHIANLVRL